MPFFKVRTGRYGRLGQSEEKEIRADYKQVFDLSNSEDRKQYNFLLKSDKHTIVAEEDLGHLTAVYVDQEEE